MSLFSSKAQNFNLVDSIDSHLTVLINGLKSKWPQQKIFDYISNHQLQNYILKNKESILTNFTEFEPKYFLLVVTADVFSENLEYDEAQEMALMALKTADMYKQVSAKGVIYNMLGNLYGELKLYSEGAKCFHESISVLKRANKKDKLIIIYANFAGLLYKMGHASKNYFDSARIYLGKSITLANELNDIMNLQSAYQTLGLLETDLKHFTDAEKALNKSLQINKQLNDTVMIGYTYYQLGRCFVGQGKEKTANTALKYLDTAYQYAIILYDMELVEEVVYEKAYAYNQIKEYKLSSDHALRYAELNDSLTVIGNEKMIAELNQKYQSARKEAEIKDLNLIQKEKQVQLNRQKYFLIASIIVLIIVIVAVVTLFKSNQIRKRVNNQLNEKNNLIESQKREVTAQKDLIETKNKEILDSINYARKIQLTLLANEDLLKNNLRDHFVLFKPKDIVSGDFYWATIKGDKFYMAVCDCTGHGVPGAFMSLLNIGFLNEAINEKNILQPNEIFNYVRQRLIESVSREEQQDGMDGVLLCVDKSNGHITYAAANNAPVLISSNNINELPFDKMPVGKGVNESKFNLYGVKPAPQDTLYLYTDGYADQFGGPKGKKFKYKQLNELLSSIHSKNTQEQKENLEAAFSDWKKGLEQVDDVCIIGLRI